MPETNIQGSPATIKLMQLARAFSKASLSMSDKVRAPRNPCVYDSARPSETTIDGIEVSPDLLYQARLVTPKKRIGELVVGRSFILLCMAGEDNDPSDALLAFSMTALSFKDGIQVNNEHHRLFLTPTNVLFSTDEVEQKWVDSLIKTATLWLSETDFHADPPFVEFPSDDFRYRAPEAH